MVGGVSTVADNALHSCLLLVERKDITDQLALGCGSIVSRNRILTAAHVVRRATGVQAGFYQRRMVAGQMRRANSLYVQPYQRFNHQLLQYDLAMVVFAPYTFPIGNIIEIAPAIPTNGVAFVAGYGFQSASSNTPSLLPLLAPLTISAECSGMVNATKSHFCAIANQPAVLCPGDNGAGLYTVIGNNVKLVNIRLFVLLVFDKYCIYLRLVLLQF